MQTMEKTEYPALKRLGSRIGYGFAIGISLVLIYIVHNIEEWGWFSFLTDAFGEVIPWITFSLAAGVLAYLAYIIYDSRNVRLLGEMITNLITVAVTWEVLTVYPFDFSAYDFPWDFLVRAMMVLAIVGASIGAVVNAVKLVKSAEA